MPPNSPFVMNVIPTGKFSINSGKDNNYYFTNGNIFCKFSKPRICINYAFSALKDLIKCRLCTCCMSIFRLYGGCQVNTSTRFLVNNIYLLTKDAIYYTRHFTE